MRSRMVKIHNPENSYDLSISDLMSALCCVFLLFLSVTIYRYNVQKLEYETKNKLATQYKDKQEELFNAIEKEFSTDKERWNVEIASVDGAIRIRFTNDAMMFEGGKDILKPEFELVLVEFFGRLIKIVGSKEFCEDILEIRIEGHTMKVQMEDVSAFQDYKRGMEISMGRTQNVLLFCLQNSNLPYSKIDNQDTEQWIRERIVAIGYSNSIPGDTPEKSRRVEFKIRTKAESVIDEIHKLDGIKIKGSDK